MGDDTKAVVLLSGGQDSTTTLFWALQNYHEVCAVSFDYGQRHKVELDLARRTTRRLALDHVVLPVEALSHLGAASLTNNAIVNTPAGAPSPDGWHASRGLPPSFVPGRNLLFFTLGAAYGIPRGYDTLVTGVCQQDRAGYPDCRSEFVGYMQQAIREGMDEPAFTIEAPLLFLSKAETWALAGQLGVLEVIVKDTHTCYEGNREQLHEWGYGCGVCGACVERERGYREFISLAKGVTAEAR